MIAIFMVLKSASEVGCILTQNVAEDAQSSDSG